MRTQSPERLEFSFKISATRRCPDQRWCMVCGVPFLRRQGEDSNALWQQGMPHGSCRCTAFGAHDSGKAEWMQIVDSAAISDSYFCFTINVKEGRRFYFGLSIGGMLLDPPPRRSEQPDQSGPMGYFPLGIHLVHLGQAGCFSLLCSILSSFQAGWYGDATTYGNRERI